MKKAIILRGLPGSGKNFWLQAFCDALPSASAERLREGGIFSTDDFFISEGVYCFDATRLTEYHQRNLVGFIEALAREEPLVICNNTNLAHWEFMPYQAVAQALGYDVELVLIGAPADPAHQRLCADRNLHGVSLGAIRQMAKAFEP